ncbi:MAG: EAL domain-containing protein [Sterolibacteriaceae bacterium]|uniref:EAL domain-containing protein n=1 Tax=Candidatus Methylophosphatis roskildensis TaxID=2899263 RepID=A0A9D7HKX8_9PROT|nr:EAL domain-containing protein [Candidatus Methylophosphatis roskildensis]MBK7235096.1 EAL domain-containing protein [Sterolibacteriaceae bacterium]
MTPQNPDLRKPYLPLGLLTIAGAGTAWGLMNPGDALGAFTASALAASVTAALSFYSSLRATRQELATQTDSAQSLANELVDSRAKLDVAVRSHRQELDSLQAQLQVETTRRETAQRLALQTTHNDALTKLPNRTRLQEDLTKALAAAERRAGKVAVMFVDLDDFKRINDTLGHGIGDELLTQAAARLSACVRTEDDVAINRGGEPSSVARVGGDEFVLLFRDVADQNALAAVAQRLIDAFRAPFGVSGYKVQSSISVGIACYPRDGNYGDTLLKHADMAMYRAKEEGKDGFQFFSHAMSAAASRRLAVENGLRKALENQQFVVHYQPKVETGTNRVIGAEALVRWRSPMHGLVAPASFIEIAEEAGLIAHIGEWVLMQACRQQRAWQEAGLPSIQMAVNVSSMQFREDHLLTAVVTAVKQTGIDPKLLQLEVTENLFMKNMNAARNTLECIRGLGATVAIDDFGTGYSSFSYLRQLPVDSVKIDRSFVQDLGTKADDREITRAIVNLARTLGVKTVAEGVETKQQAEILAEMGCNEMQGFLYAPPVDANTMAKILKIGVIPPDSLAGKLAPFMPPTSSALTSGDAAQGSFDLHSQATLLVPIRVSDS